MKTIQEGGLVAKTNRLAPEINSEIPHFLIFTYFYLQGILRQKYTCEA